MPSVESSGKGGFFRDVMGYDEPGLKAALRGHLVRNFGEAEISGSRIRVLEAGKTPVSAPVDDEIHAVYPVEGWVVLVCELSVRLLDKNLQLVETLSSKEVLSASWWEAGLLHVKCDSGQVVISLEGARLSIVAPRRRRGANAHGAQRS